MTADLVISADAELTKAPIGSDDLLRVAVRDAMRSGKTQSALSREIGISDATLSQWLKGAYKGNVEAIDAKVDNWAKNRQASVAAALPGTPRLVNTPTGDDINRRLIFAQHQGSISLVYGGAGVGKTTAVRRYQAANPNVWVVTIRPSGASIPSMLEDVAAALDLRGLPNRPSVVSVEVIRRVTGTRGLLVIDEAQHMSVAALEELRSIHDASGVGVALVGNEAVYSRLTGGARSAVFAQLFSRIGSRLHLAKPQDGDVDALLDAWSVGGNEERAWARRVAVLPGGLRGLVHTLRQAKLTADGPINLRDLGFAWRDLGGEA